MTQQTIEVLKKIWAIMQRRPVFCHMVIIALVFGIIFIFLGSPGLLLKLLSRRPLFYFGLYFVLIIGVLFSYYLYSRTKSKAISNATFNHFLRDVSSTIKTVIVLFLSFYLTANTATKIISVYFNRYDSQYHMGGSNNTYNLYPPGPYPIGSEIPKSELLKKEPVKNDVTPSENISGNLPVTTEKIQKKEIVLTIPSIYFSQEYPSSQGYKYTQSINLTGGSPAVMTLKKNEQPMWFGIGNSGLSNIGSPTLFLNFDGAFDVKATDKESLGWMTMDPNRQFNTKINMIVQPGSGVKLYPLFVKFPRAGKYSGKYTIATDNNLPINGFFTINVVEE